jgi:hypothetical protein
MKSKILFLFVLGVLFIFFGTQLFCLELGLKFGISHSQASLSRELPGITIGTIDEFFIGSYFSHFFIGDQLGLQPEINYTVKGFDVLEMEGEQEISSKYKITYIEIPVLISYRFPLRGRVKPGLVFGPYFGLAQKVMEVQNIFGEIEKRELGDNLKEVDVGLVFGANVRYELRSFSMILSLRYNLGLGNISKNITEVAWDFYPEDTIKNRALTIRIGIAFNLFSRKT